MFYKFDYILHANKYLKMGKHFLINIIQQNKQSIRNHLIRATMILDTILYTVLQKLIGL